MQTVFNDKLANKLKSESLSWKDWWPTLKQIITPYSKSSVPPLEFNNKIYTDEIDKVNILNNFFKSQTFLDDRNAVLPDLPPATVDFHLDHIVFTPYEDESIIKTLTIGKASGPNGVSVTFLENSQINCIPLLLFL